jgi:beta-lactamase regulating signal transducer with metallopeptidase domain
MSFDFMIEMAWKSALIAGLALLLAATLRSRAAADRAAVLRVAVALLLLLPIFSVGLPKLEIEAWTAEAVAVPAQLPEAATIEAVSDTPAAATVTAPDPTIWDDPSLLFLILYLGGMSMAAVRLGAGLWTLRTWTRNAREVDCPRWVETFDRARWAAGAPQRLRLLVSDEAPSPLSWGLMRPVILIDPDTLAEPEDADAILAHEIAHVVRRDWAVLMLTRVAAALFWFNPLVWLLEREVVQQAEEAADIEAALWVEPARYAQTLVHWAQFSAAAAIPANSIAPSAHALARRVRAILDARLRSTPSGSPWTVAAIGGCALFAVTLAVLQLIPAVAQASEAPPAPPPAPAAAPGPAALAAPPPVHAAALIVEGRALAAPPAVPLAPVAGQPLPIAPLPGSWPVAALGAGVAAPQPPPPAPAPRPPVPPRVDVDTLVQMRIHGIDADYIRALAEANARLARLRTDELVALRVHGVSADYVRALAAAGYRDLDADQIVAFRIHGVTASDARRGARGGRRLSPDELVGRAIHDDTDEDKDQE